MSNNDAARVLPEVTMTPELAEAIKNAVSIDSVKALMVAEAEKQLEVKTQLDADQAAAAQAAADKTAADQAAAEAAAKANQVFTRTETIGGKDISFSASTEAELDRQVLSAFKTAYAIQQTPAPVEPVVDQAAVAAAAEAEVLAKAELERKFRLGEISAAEYIQQSGAVNEYLTKQGLSVDTLKDVVEKNKQDAEIQSWEAASEVFKNTSGADWPGGVKNRTLLGDKMAAMGLFDAKDKVAAMAQAWEAMKSTGGYFPHGDEPVAAAAPPAVAVPDPAKVAADAAAVAAEAVRVAAAAKVKSSSSSFFDASSGVSGAPVLNPAVIEAKKVVPADASPEEIIRAWKEAQVAGGISPDDAFKKAFSGKAI
jgi:hypothetical protein